MQLPSWVWLWVRCQHYILSHGNLLGLSGTSPCRSCEVFLSSLGCWKQPWFSLSFFNNTNREHGLHSGCQQYSLCPMLKFFLLAISYCCTANHRNFKLQEFLRFIHITVFCSSDLGLLFYTTNHSQFSSLLTHWFILNHIQWFQLVFVFMYYFAFESISQAFYTKKPKTVAREHDQGACLPYLPAFRSFPPGKQVDLNAWKTLRVNSVTRKMSCPVLCPPVLSLSPTPTFMFL